MLLLKIFFRAKNNKLSHLSAFDIYLVVLFAVFSNVAFSQKSLKKIHFTNDTISLDIDTKIDSTRLYFNVKFKNNTKDKYLVISKPRYSSYLYVKEENGTEDTLNAKLFLNLSDTEYSDENKGIYFLVLKLKPDCSYLFYDTVNRFSFMKFQGALKKITYNKLAISFSYIDLDKLSKTDFYYPSYLLPRKLRYKRWLIKKKNLRLLKLNSFQKKGSFINTFELIINE